MVVLFDQEYATEMYGYNQRKAGREEGRKEGMAKGMQQGMAKGRAEGMAKGRAEGILQGMARGTLSTLIGLVKDGLLGKTEAAQRVNMTVEEFEKAVNSLQ